jgi:uncharacterized membrane protein YebE (DUF533 family)
MKRLTIGVHACTETLALLIAMAWADGKFEDAEKEAVRGAAEVFNLPRDLRARLEELMKKPSPIDELLFDTVSEHDRAFAFVAATWMASADEDVDPKEEALLDQIATKLAIGHEQRADLANIARDMPKRGGKAPSASEISTLFQAIPRQLHGIDDSEAVELVVE